MRRPQLCLRCLRLLLADLMLLHGRLREHVDGHVEDGESFLVLEEESMVGDMHAAPVGAASRNLLHRQLQTAARSPRRESVVGRGGKARKLHIRVCSDGYEREKR